MFLKPNSPLLTKVATKIPQNQINSSETRRIVETMLKVLNGQRHNRKRPTGVGLAAPQIGILKRIILVDVKADGKSLPAGRQGKVGEIKVYINPQITWTSKEKGEWYEGCYSTSRVCGIVSRPTSIKIKAFSLKSMFPHRKWGFGLVEENYSGYVARIFQHEIDHLNGIVFVDHIKDPNKLHWVLKKEFPLYRDRETWRNWPKKCSFEKWRKIKNS